DGRLTNAADMVYDVLVRKDPRVRSRHGCSLPGSTTGLSSTRNENADNPWIGSTRFLKGSIMKSLLASVTAVGLLLLLGAEPVWAQNPFARPGQSPYTRPAYSPYLNLNRFGGTTSQNYFGLVRPELQALTEDERIRGQILSLQQQGLATQQYSEFMTGHTTGFMTHHRFFMTRTGQQGGGGGFTGGGTGLIGGGGFTGGAG